MSDAAESDERSVSSRPDVDLVGVIQDRLELYRAVVSAALKLPRSIGASTHVTPVANTTLNETWRAIEKLLDNTDDLDALL